MNRIEFGFLPKVFMLTLSPVATGNDDGGAHSFISAGRNANKEE